MRQLDAMEWLRALQWRNAPQIVLRLPCGLNAKCLWLTDPLPLRTLEVNQNSQVRALKGIYYPLPFSLTFVHTHSVFKHNQQDTPLQVCLLQWGSHCPFKTSFFFLGSNFLFFLSFNTIMTLFTIDSKDNTGSTRQGKTRKIPGANACGQKDEKALHEWWK